MRRIMFLKNMQLLLGAVMLCFFFTLSGIELRAQSEAHVISGTVTDKETGQPIQGVTVTSRKSGAAAITLQNGSFTLQVKSNNDTLEVSTIGYNTQYIYAGNLASVNIILEKNYSRMEDVVVIGYGTSKKRNVVGATDIVSAKDAGATTATNPSQLLIGKAAGVQIIQSNGTPGADAQIIIRGTGSFTSVDPLYVIDGIQGDKTLFNTLSAQDIENITILKDASSTAIYGSAAANGVVMITTKKGKTGPPKISVTSQWGVANVWKKFDLLNAAQYVELLKEFAATSNTTLPAKFNTPAVLVDSNNWQDNVLRTALVSENNFNISGGSEKMTYGLSLGYITQQSSVIGFENKRFNGRIYLEERLGRFRLGQSLSVRQTKSKGRMASLMDAISYAPYKPIYDKSIPGGYSIVTNVDDFSNALNPLQAVNLENPVTNDYIFFPQSYVEVDLIRGLKFRTQFSAEIGGDKSTNYKYPYTLSNNLTSPRQAELGYGSYSYYVLENYFSFDHKIGNHSVSATLGNSYIDPGVTSGVKVAGSNLPNDNIQNVSVSPSQTVTSSSYGYAHASMISYFGRLNYTYNSRYILTASFRRDGASNFGKNNRFGNFPGVGVAWRLSDENFMKKLPFVSDAKLRAGWGRTGNNSIPTTGITSVLTFSGSPAGNAVYAFGSSEALTNGTTINTLANPDIKWESTDQTDIGLDISFLKNRLYMTIDWYNRKSSGLLVQVPVPGSTGASNSGTQPAIYANAASAVNKGIEFTVGYRGNAGKLSYNVNANFSYNKNRVLSLGSQFTAPIKDGKVSGSSFTYTAPGSTVGAFYGYRLDHVAKDQAEIDDLNSRAPGGVFQSGLLAGDFIFKDINGDGVVNSDDQEIIGSPIPKFIYGFNAGVNYGSFDLNIVLSGIAGVDAINGVKGTTSIEATGHNATTAILDRWRKPGDVASLPRAGQNANASGNLRPSDWWLESGAYIRLRNITIGYALPHNIINRIAGANTFTGIRIYIAAQNLFTITKYSGYDPELSTQSGVQNPYIFTRGIDEGTLPQPRTFMAGIQLGF